MQDSSRDHQYRQFVQLFVRHERAIRAFVRSLLPSWADVDDVMQEISLACWRKFDEFSQTESTETSDEFSRWACMIGRFEVLRHRRKHARDRLVLNEDVIELLAADAQTRWDVANKERNAVERCLQKLGKLERRLLLSVHTPGDSVARIAEEVDQKARRLYSKVNTLRNILAECVRERLAKGDLSDA